MTSTSAPARRAARASCIRCETKYQSSVTKNRSLNGVGRRSPKYLTHQKTMKRRDQPGPYVGLGDFANDQHPTLGFETQLRTLSRASPCTEFCSYRILTSS